MKFLARSIAVSMALFCAATFAAHCPLDMKKIDAALATNPPLSAAERDEVTKLRAEGESLHKAGDHGKSVEVLGKAMKILKIE
jgi:hypothetical protein